MQLLNAQKMKGRATRPGQKSQGRAIPKGDARLFGNSDGTYFKTKAVQSPVRNTRSGDLERFEPLTTSYIGSSLPER
jgi:hypothetical protein